MDTNEKESSTACDIVQGFERRILLKTASSGTIFIQYFLVIQGR